MIMFGDQEFEKVLLHLSSSDRDPAADDRALAALNMLCLDSTGEHNQSHVRPSHTAQYPHSIFNSHLFRLNVWLQHACSCWVNMDHRRDALMQGEGGGGGGGSLGPCFAHVQVVAKWPSCRFCPVLTALLADATLA